MGGESPGLRIVLGSEDMNALKEGARFVERAIDGRRLHAFGKASHGRKFGKERQTEVVAENPADGLHRAVQVVNPFESLADY